MTLLSSISSVSSVSPPSDGASAAPTTGERRKQRSADPLVALHYQLAQSRSRSAVEAIVLADTSGVVVAGAGSWVICEELAAYAPLFSQSNADSQVIRIRKWVCRSAWLPFEPNAKCGR